MLLVDRAAATSVFVVATDGHLEAPDSELGILNHAVPGCRTSESTCPECHLIKPKSLVAGPVCVDCA